MKIVLAPDSYKGSLSAFEVAKVMERAALHAIPTADVHTLPMADGGEGTLDCLLHKEKSLKIPITVTGPIGKRIATYYGVLNKRTAVIEAAMMNGLTLVPSHLQHPDYTTTYGVGEAMLHALDRGCKEFIICIGGSATNDGGFGMLQALGAKAYDERGHALSIFGKDLFQMAHMEWEGLDQRLENVSIQVVCDVDNPLLGENGCSFVYGPQKGLSQIEARKYDEGLRQYSQIISSAVGKEFADEKNAGSAGGLGFAFLALGASVLPGASFVAKSIQLEKEIADAALVLTGEGRTDEQTLHGKAPGYVATLAQKHAVPVCLISGSLSRNRAMWRDHYTAVFSIVNEPISLEESMGEVEQLLFEQTADVIYLMEKMQLKE